MRIGLGRLTLAASLATMIISCSGGDDDAANGLANAAAAPGTNNLAEAEMPDLESNQAASAPRCPETPGTACFGPLVVRAENLNLFADGAPYSDGGRRLAARGNLVFENRTDAPIRLAVLRAPADALFNTGLRLGALSTSGVDITGVLSCDQDGPQCFQAMPERFQTLVPADSPARANIGFHGRMDASLAASLPTVSSATITLQVYVVNAENVGTVLNISLPNVQVRNQLSQ